MIIDENIVLNDCEVIDKMGNSNIVVYGAGADGKEFQKKYGEFLHIDFFIDGNAGSSYENISILKVEDAIKKITNQIIVICSRKYAYEMKRILDDYGFTGGQNYFIWDVYYDVNVQNFIEHNQKKWMKHEQKENNSILIPIECVYDRNSIIYSYFANYFAEKYQARILAYIRRGGTKFEPRIYPSMVDIYKSFGVQEIIEITESEEISRKVEEIYNDIVTNIKNTSDWDKIVVEGMNIGLSVIRDYFRFYPLSFEPLSDDFKECLRAAIKKILFWKEFLKNNQVKTIILWDGVHNESYLRELALRDNIPVYIIESKGVHKIVTNHNYGVSFPNLKKFFGELTYEEKQVGLKWASKLVNNMLNGSNEVNIPYRGSYSSVFQYDRKNLNLDDSEKLKILICPHIFDEDEWLNGEQICDNNFISWLEFLGKTSEETDYDWFLKLHPDEGERGRELMRKFVELYPKIRLLPSQISPLDIKNAGFKYVLTIAGSVGHEYPLLGIDVINAGNNPHMSFGFNITPKDKEEYRKILLNISEYSAAANSEEIYEFYCIYYLYYKKNNFSYELKRIFDDVNFENDEMDTYVYADYLNHYLSEKDDKIMHSISDLIHKVDEWTPNKLMKKSNEEIEMLLNA